MVGKSMGTGAKVCDGHVAVPAQDLEAWRVAVSPESAVKDVASAIVPVKEKTPCGIPSAVIVVNCQKRLLRFITTHADAATVLEHLSTQLRAIAQPALHDVGMGLLPELVRLAQSLALLSSAGGPNLRDVVFAFRAQAFLCQRRLLTAAGTQASGEQVVVAFGRSIHLPLVGFRAFADGTDSHQSLAEAAKAVRFLPGLTLLGFHP